MSEFFSLLHDIEKHAKIKRIIPGRINRQQKWSSNQYLHFSYLTQTGMKYTMCKGGTAQELFIICAEEDKEIIKMYIDSLAENA